MDNKFTISKGTNTISSVNQNTFTYNSGNERTFSFTPRKTGVSTPTNTDKITLQNRRQYHYYAKT